MPLDGPLLADHSSHSSHSSHVSSSTESSGSYPDSSGSYSYPASPTAAPDPTAAPVPTTTPEPAPTSPPAAHLEDYLLKKLSKLTDLWPKEVVLLQDSSFTAYKDGKPVVNTPVTAGTTVELVKVDGTMLLLCYQNNYFALVDAGITDLGTRVDVKAIIAAPVPTPTPFPAPTQGSPR